MVVWLCKIVNGRNFGDAGVADKRKEALVGVNGQWKTQDIEGQAINTAQKTEMTAFTKKT